MTVQERLYKQLQFIHEVDQIKYILRKTKLFNSDRPENDAEHSWHLAIMAMTLYEHSAVPIDLLKVIKMVLIHDIVEIDAGDIFFFDKNQKHDNRKEELVAAKRIFGILPKEQGEELLNLWIEFEDKQTPEAKFASVLDRLEPMLQNASNQGGTWDEFDVRYDEVLNSKRIMTKTAPTLWEYTQKLLSDCVKQGILKEN